MRFRPEQHLRRQGDIRAARESGRRLDGRSFVIWSRHRDAGNETQVPRVAVIASKAAVGGAIERNRAKRRLREVFRKHQDRVPPDCDLLLIARSAVIRRPFSELEQAFVEACSRLGSPKA